MSKSKKMQPMNLITIGFSGIILSGMISLLVDDTTILAVILFLLVVFGVVLVWGYITLQTEKRNGKAKVLENSNTFRKEYDIYAEQLGVVKSNVQAELIGTSEYGLDAHIPHYLWIADNSLNMFPMEKYFERNSISAVNKPNVSQLQVISVPIEDILYFEEVGELQKYTKVSGGGTSLKGALTGYIIAGDIGAIIGSREPIKTEIVSEDDRIVELIYKNYDGEIANLEFTHDAYVVLKKVIPEKELRRITNLKD